MRTPFDQRWFAALFATYASPASLPGTNEVDAATPTIASTPRVHDWGEAPDTELFVGRTRELAVLHKWVEDKHSRLVAVQGIGGIGKTTLAAKVAEESARRFERVYWRGLRDAPPISEWLAGVIGFLSDHQLVPPPFESERITALLELLRLRRCLLVLDNSAAAWTGRSVYGIPRAPVHWQSFRAILGQSGVWP